MINLSNSTPAAPTGGYNVQWQQDSSGNVSAYVGAASVTPTTVAPVAGVLTLNAALGNIFYVNVNAAITSMSITNPTDGQVIEIFWAQDSTGHAITLATNLVNATAPSTTANVNSIQTFMYHSADSNWYATAAGLPGTASTPTTPVTYANVAASYALAFAANGNQCLDLTLTANTTFTLTAPSSSAQYRVLTLVIRPAGFTATLPASSGALVWNGGSAPVPSTSNNTLISFGSTGVAPVFGGI